VSFFVALSVVLVVGSFAAGCLVKSIASGLLLFGFGLVLGVATIALGGYVTGGS
jgi:hypothetical protein